MTTKEIESFIEWMTQMGFLFIGKHPIDSKKYYLMFHNTYFNINCCVMPFMEEYVYFETFKEDDVFSGSITELRLKIFDDLKIRYESVNLQYKDIFDGNKRTTSKKTKD